MLKDYLEEKVYLKQQNRFLRFFIFLLCLALISSSLVIIHVVKMQKVILVPVGLSRKVAVSSEEVDEAYIEEMTELVMCYALNYTPQNVEWRFTRLLELFTPDVYPEYRKTFTGLAGDVKSTGVTSSFHITGIKYNPAKKKILVEGYLYQWTKDKRFISDSLKRYILGYDVHHGKFMLTGFRECVKNCGL